MGRHAAAATDRDRSTLIGALVALAVLAVIFAVGILR